MAMTDVETVRDYWTANADEGDQRLALRLYAGLGLYACAEGWEIVQHKDGLTVLSPGTSIAELNRDDSTETMSSLTAILNEERT